MSNFRDITGYEGLYQISDTGLVKSLGRFDALKRWVKEKILKASPDPAGYLQVNLYKNGIQKKYRVHSLVAKMFLNHEKSNHKMVVDHIDNVKTNNCLNNLQVVSARLNSMKDKKEKTSSRYVGVTWSTHKRRWRASIGINGKKKFLGLYVSEEEAAKAYKEALDQISDDYIAMSSYKM